MIARLSWLRQWQIISKLPWLPAFAHATRNMHRVSCCCWRWWHRERWAMTSRDVISHVDDGGPLVHWSLRLRVRLTMDAIMYNATSSVWDVPTRRSVSCCSPFICLSVCFTQEWTVVGCLIFIVHGTHATLAKLGYIYFSDYQQ